MSTLNVDKVDPSTGTALELGTSGDTITVPTGAGLTVVDEVKTNKVSPATGTAFALGDSGDTFTIPSGATITNSGTATGFGGITTASQWRLTTSATGNLAPIASNWEVNDTTGYSSLGSAMTQSSGIFTFPSTGYWLITFICTWYLNGSSKWIVGGIRTTIDDGTYVTASESYSSITRSETDTTYASSTAQTIFDVTSTSNCKVRFNSLVNNTSTTTYGETAQNTTGATFIRLGDT